MYQSLCEVTDSNANDDNSNANGLHQVDSSYGHFRCITCNCKSCPDQVLLEILENKKHLQSLDGDCCLGEAWIPQ